MRSLTVAPNVYASAVLGNRPAAYYQLSDSTSTLLDSGPHSISGNYGSSVTEDVEAITSGATGAAGFPGGASYNSNGFAFTPPNAALQPARTTLEAWFILKAHNTTGHELPLVVYGTAGRGVRYGIYVHGLGASGDCLEYQQRNVGQPALNFCSNTHLTIGATYHVVVSSNAGIISTYFNGVPDRSAAYAGSIDYTQGTADGLQIGGANQVPAYAGASFPGTIAQVAVYASPLSQAQVTAHFLTGQLVPMVTESPTNADTFVGSIGVNAHFDNPYSVYGTQYPTIRSLLVASGIRHIRATVAYNNAAYLSMMKDLAASGIHGLYTTQLNLTQAQIQAWPAIVGSSFEGYEPPNEQDDVGNANWLPQCIAFQKNLYSWVKSDPQIAKYPVLAPSLTNSLDYPSLAGLNAYLDAGNIHDYMSFFNPGTTGWGPYHAPYGWYGSITYNLNLGRVVSGTKPMIATETGYGTTAGNPMTLDLRADLRYMTRLFFEQLNGGITRSYSYELVDSGAGSIFSNFGLIQSNLTPKPAYTGIKSLIGALTDPGAPFTSSPLTYNLSGFMNNVHHTLLQKRSGQYVLAIWLEVPDWITLANAGGDIIVPAQSVTLTTARKFSSASYSTMDDSGHLTTAQMSWNGNSATIAVTDKVSLINLTP